MYFCSEKRRIDTKIDIFKIVKKVIIILTMLLLETVIVKLPYDILIWYKFVLSLLVNNKTGNRCCVCALLTFFYEIVSFLIHLYKHSEKSEMKSKKFSWQVTDAKLYHRKVVKQSLYDRRIRIDSQFQLFSRNLIFENYSMA